MKLQFCQDVYRIQPGDQNKTKQKQPTKQKFTKLLVQVATNLNQDYGSLKIQIRWKFLWIGVFNYDTDPHMSYDSGAL